MKVAALFLLLDQGFLDGAGHLNADMAGMVEGGHSANGRKGFKSDIE